jgi:hypothetical protein
MLDDFKKQIEIFKSEVDNWRVEQCQIDALEKMHTVIDTALEHYTTAKYNCFINAFCGDLEEISQDIETLCADARVRLGEQEYEYGRPPHREREDNWNYAEV